MSSRSYDVAIVGLGPVGLTAAALLAARGHRVVGLERHTGLYGLPRAATFDDETMRTFARLGIADRLLPTIRYQPTYEWCNSVGDVLIEYHYAERGASGWAEWYQMYQPDLEDALLDACLRSGAELRFGSEVTGYASQGDDVEIVAGDDVIRASYVIAADGGNGFTRDIIGASLTDFGFAEPWMVCDFRYESNPGVPWAQQIGDPNGPTSIIGLGPHHHRFSFMLDAVEDFASESSASAVWERVSHHLSPQQAELVRVATYTFRSLLADAWRSGRILLAGDAAHQMPPFLGQGMCSGIRDVVNLAFKLDLVIGGASGALLDTYQTERSAHVEAIILKGIELGRAQTIRDPALAAERDSRLQKDKRSNHGPQRLVFPHLGAGFFGSAPSPGRGALVPQGRIPTEFGPRRFDDAVTAGFQLIVRAGALSDASISRVDATNLIDAVVTIGEADDLDGVYLSWLAVHHARGVLVRPDGYAFGTFADDAELLRLLSDLTEFLTTSHPEQAGAAL